MCFRSSNQSAEELDYAVPARQPAPCLGIAHSMCVPRPPARPSYKHRAGVITLVFTRRVPYAVVFTVTHATSSGRRDRTEKGCQMLPKATCMHG
jgi:hypothetical protein